MKRSQDITLAFSSLLLSFIYDQARKMLFTESSRQTRKEERFKYGAFSRIELPEIVRKVRFREGSVNPEAAIISWSQFFLGYIGLPDAFCEFRNLLNTANLVHIPQKPMKTRDALEQSQLFHGSSSNSSR